MCENSGGVFKRDAGEGSLGVDLGPCRVDLDKSLTCTGRSVFDFIKIYIHYFGVHPNRK